VHFPRGNRKIARTPTGERIISQKGKNSQEVLKINKKGKGGRGGVAVKQQTTLCWLPSSKQPQFSIILTP